MTPCNEPADPLASTDPEPAPRLSPMRVGGALLTLAVVLALGVWLHGQPPAREAMSRAAAMPTGIWAAALAGLLLSHALRALRLQQEWRVARPLSFATCLRVILTHAAAVGVLPMRAGELGLPLMLHRHGQVPWTDGALSLTWMRLQDVVVVSGLGAATFAISLAHQGRLEPLLAALAVAAIGATIAALAWGTGRPARIDVLRSQEEPDRMPAWRRALARGASRANLGSWGWSLAAWLAKLITLAALLRALAHASPLGAWVGVLGGDGASALPLQPAAGFGTYEAGVALALRWSEGADWHETLGAALVVHLFFVLVAVVGATLMTLWPRLVWRAPSKNPGPAP